MTGAIDRAPDWQAAREAAARALAIWDGAGPGAVILGFGPAGEAFAQAAGHEAPGGAALSAGSVLRWASMTKHVFANVLIESGLLPLDTALGAVLDMHPVPGAVTVRQALSMQGGLPDTREMLTLAGLSADEVTRADDLLRWSAALPRLNAEPGTEVAYSNAGYRLAEAALEARGMRFDAAVAAISARLGLGMRAAQFWSDPVPGLAPGHVPDPAGWRNGAQGMHLSAAGSLAGSARDLSGWLADLMTRDSFALQAAPAVLRDGRPTDYGLGLRRTAVAGRVLIGHGGSQSGYRAAFLLAPELRAGVVVLSNRDDADAEGMARRVLCAALGLEAPMRPATGWAAPGLYVGEGNLWAEVRDASIVLRDAEEPLFADADGWASARPGRPVTRLRQDGADLVGEIGYLACRLRPVRPCADAIPEGVWHSDGHVITLRDGAVTWGRGPNRRQSALEPLGGGRWLFRAMGRRICLRRTAADRIELSLARARVAEYSPLGQDAAPGPG
ncbi:serine hydrolase domain-containing protein [Frigidibacter sp. MR17.24]|uniref:serine hydrolase domain-containing protein n=1 Tax=Frigidibacter sp. MR17.24 TaxID=3127345 RepID=UPI003012E64F